MAKKTIALTLAALAIAGLLSAQELEISGEVKTGFYWERLQVQGQETEEITKMHNNDNAGEQEGLFRLNLHLRNDYNMGMRVRYEQKEWNSISDINWTYAMAYAHFIDDQLRISIGRLGESPWGAGGPDIWKDLDDKFGIRAEVMPRVVPGLDVGLVLNAENASPYNREGVDSLLVDKILKETVFGAAYTHDYFHGRFSWRLDGDFDVDDRSPDGKIKVEDNMEMIYRLEERIIREYLEGFSIFAVGHWKGIGEDSDVPIVYSTYNFKNYLYIDYAPRAFSAQLGPGLQITKGVFLLTGRASFYFNFQTIVDGLPLRAGFAVSYQQLYGENAFKDGKPFLNWGIEPQVRYNFSANAYVAFVYNFGQQYKKAESEERVLQNRQWINLRVSYLF